MFINSLAHAFTNSFNEEVHDDDKYASQPEYKYIYMIGPLAAAEHSFDFQGKSYEEFVWRAISIRQSAPLYHRKQICRCYHHIDSIQKTAGTVCTPGGWGPQGSAAIPQIIQSMIGPLAAAEHSFDLQGKSYEEFVWRAISIRQSVPLYHRKQICSCYHHIDSIQKTAGTVGTPSLNDARSSTELLLEQSDHSSDCIGGPEAQYARKHFLHSYGSFLW